VHRRLRPDAAARDRTLGGRPDAGAPNSKGSGPFTFTSRAKTFSVTAGDSCDVRQTRGVEQRLAQGARLRVLAGGTGTGGGLVTIDLLGGFRNAAGNKAPFHVQVTLTQGSRRVFDARLCAWYQSGFVLAKGTGVSCWW
jgi:hypothetical protein